MLRPARRPIVQFLPAVRQVDLSVGETPVGFVGVARAGKFAVGLTLGKSDRRVALREIEERIRLHWGPNVHFNCKDGDLILNWIRDYLAGRNNRLDGIPVGIPFCSQFAAKIYRILRATKPGSIITYQALAEAAGRPKAARAVGNWMRRNPVPLLIPCHRVVRADGSLGRYSEGDRWKAILVDLERRAWGESQGRILQVKVDEA